MVLDKVKKYFPTKEERGKHTGFLSTLAEYHAIAVGFIIYLTNPHLLGLIMAYGVLGSGARVKLTGQYKDAAKEPAYTALGLLLGEAWKHNDVIADIITSIT